MLAIIKAGGKQYKVGEGDVLELEKLDGEVGKSIIFDEVLLIGSGKDIQIGTPYIKNAQVEAKILEQKKGRKVVVFKYRPKKRYRRKRGSRQLLTRIKIEKIVGGDQKTKKIKQKEPKKISKKANKK